MIYLLITIFTLLILLIYKYAIKPFKFWDSLEIKQQSLFAVYQDMFNIFLQRKSFLDYVVEKYKSFPNDSYYGMYHMLQPTILIKDPDLIKRLTIKDFDHFADRMQFIPQNVDSLWDKSLVALSGQKWKDMRAILSPNFTSSKMKNMFVLIQDCAKEYRKKILNDCAEKSGFELGDLFTRYSNDVIATAAFGIKIDSYTEKENDFYVMGKKLLELSGVTAVLKLILCSLFPKLVKRLGLGFFPKATTKFFVELVKETVKVRKEQGIVRSDLIHLLMEAKKDGEMLSDEDICAQALIFFFAGFGSVANNLSFMGYELAVNPDVQDRLNKEIEETLKKYNGNVTYEAIMGMKYMDMVVNETLRKWPAAIIWDRKCTIPYGIEIPKMASVKTVDIPKGANLLIPVFAIQRDPEYYQDPDKFNPERFSDENKGNIKPYTFIPFGVGQRNCLGSRFALMEIKTIFFYLLQEMEIVPNAKTPIPMKLLKKSVHLCADPGFFVDLKARN